MAFDIGSLVPNWELFVEWLLPIVLAVIFAMALVYRFVTRRRMTLAEMLNYIPVLYLFFVFYEIGEYMYGTREHVWDRLFAVHFPNMMFLIVCVGIGQVLYYFNSERGVSA